MRQIELVIILEILNLSVGIFLILLKIYKPSITQEL